jgi:acetyl-CoA acetyltransferase
MQDLRGQAAIVGFHELPSLRTYGERSTLNLAGEVLRGAIRDSGLRKEDIDGLIVPEAINSLTVAEALGLTPRFTNCVTTHGASGTTSIGLAAMAVANGLCNYVACIFSESRPPSSSRTWGAASTNIPASLMTEWEAPYGPVIAANGGYGIIKQRHMYKYGTRDEQFARLSVDQRFNAFDNENALWKGQLITVEDVLNSRYVNDPLHLLECVMPVSGAAALIVTTAERARALPNPPVYLLGFGGPATSHDVIWQNEDVTVSPVVHSAPVAFQMAKYSVRDMQFAEFYDCYTILAMMTLEDTGLCAKGEIGNFYESTDTTYKGAFPINTDGGQISGGQPGLAGGFRHVIEATRQIMGRAGTRQVQKKDLCMVNG